jgi:predicted nucleic acid-binding protein
MMLTMNKIFLDTNILIYLSAKDESEKTNQAKLILQQHDNITISTQVLFEYSNVMRKKLKQDYVHIDAALQEFHDELNIAIIRYETIRNSLTIASQYKYSFPDSLIVATALEYNCDILFSEDMHHDQLIENQLKIINPFK